MEKYFCRAARPFTTITASVSLTMASRQVDLALAKKKTPANMPLGYNPVSATNKNFVDKELTKIVEFLCQKREYYSDNSIKNVSL